MLSYSYSSNRRVRTMRNSAMVLCGIGFLIYLVIASNEHYKTPEKIRKSKLTDGDGVVVSCKSWLDTPYALPAFSDPPAPPATEVLSAKQGYLQRNIAAFALPTYSELVAEPEIVPASAPSDVTVILNVWKRVHLLENQIKALLKQTAPPAHIWVVAFGSVQYDDALEQVQSIKKLCVGASIDVFYSSENLGYYGRFEIALSAKTRYVWVVDDDVLPGTEFLQFLVHAMRTKYRGVLGSIGWLLPGARADLSVPFHFHYTQGGVMFPDPWTKVEATRLSPVDYLCSTWFMESAWVPLLFRDPPFTRDTGEDFMLSYAVLRHVGLQTYVLPVDAANKETWGSMEQKLGWSLGTTDWRRTIRRDRQYFFYLQRGHAFQWMRLYEAENHPLRCRLLLATSETEPAAVRGFLDVFSAPSLPAFVLLITPDEKSAQDFSNAVNDPRLSYVPFEDIDDAISDVDVVKCHKIGLFVFVGNGPDFATDGLETRLQTFLEGITPVDVFAIPKASVARHSQILGGVSSFDEEVAVAEVLFRKRGYTVQKYEKQKPVKQ
eukprot:ANDGO_04676.mRNA.1 hypothetical protein